MQIRGERLVQNARFNAAMPFLQMDETLEKLLAGQVEIEMPASDGINLQQELFKADIHCVFCRDRSESSAASEWLSA